LTSLEIHLPSKELPGVGLRRRCVALFPVSRTNWEGVGVQPDVAVTPDAALDRARRLALSAIAANAAAPDDRDTAREALGKLFSASAK
jgi:hypothetical protein